MHGTIYVPAVPLRIRLVVLVLVCVNSIGCLGVFENAPIIFYGKVVDQSGAPLGGAKVNAQVTSTRWIYLTPLEDIFSKTTFSTVTDQRGDFVMTGRAGISLTIENIVAPGYDFFRAGTYSGTYDYYHFGNTAPNFHPDRRCPVVFEGWKLHGYEPLVEAVAMIPAGDWSPFDVLHGTYMDKGTPFRETAPSVDFRIRLTAQAGDTNPRHWQLVVEPVDGGIAAAPTVNPYEAFATGYAPSLVVNTTTDASGHSAGGESLNRPFYVKSRGGKVYSSVFFDVQMRPMPSVTVSSWANPTGSRFLEPPIPTIVPEPSPPSGSWLH